MTISLTDNVAGIELPDTALVRETTEYIRDVEDDLLFHHSRRVFYFGALQGLRRGCIPTWSCCTWARCSMTSV